MDDQSEQTTNKQYELDEATIKQVLRDKLFNEPDLYKFELNCKYFCREAPEDILNKNLEPLIDRFETIMDHAQNADLSERASAMEIGNDIRLALWRLASEPEQQMDQKLIDRLYQHVHSENRLLAHHAREAVWNLVVLDHRNEKPEGSESLYDRYKRETAHALAYPMEEGNMEKGDDLLRVGWSVSGNIVHDLARRAFEQADNDIARKFIWRVTANKEGLGQIRKQLQVYANLHPEFIPHLKAAEKAIGLDEADAVFLNIQDHYEELNFKEYKPNAVVLQHETNVLLNETKPTDRILDIGSGTGRLMKALKDQGRTVFGFDYVKTHVQETVALDADLQVAVASWHEMPYQNNSFDVAYCLGRSSLHNSTVEDMLAFLNESHRVIKDDGTLIMDIPNSEFGHYQKVREMIANRMDALQINHFEEGYIHDSPDGKHYFDRMSPSMEQMTAMARLAGFELEVVDRLPYTDDPNYQYENIYLRLKKTKKPGLMERLDLTRQAYTSSPALEVKFI